MTIHLNTLASGQFSVYTPTETGELKLISQSDNLVVKSGLNAVGTTSWANCLQRCLAGDSTSPVLSTNTSLGNMTLSTTNVSPAAPACYTLCEYNALSGATYRIGKTWTLQNYSGSDQTIREIGVTTTPSGSTINLFSRSLLTTPFTLEADKFAYIVYELRLKTGVSTTRQSFQVTTDGSPGFFFPLSAELGVFNCPFTILESNGTLVHTATGSGVAPFEPYTPDYYLYYLRGQGTSLIAPISSYFNDKRNFYEDSQFGLLTANNTAVYPAVIYTAAHTNGNKFSVDDGGTYITDSFKRVRHIIVSPEVPSLSENIWGFAIVNQPTTTDVDRRGLHCVFPSTTPWVRPINVFTKIYFEQTWAAN